MCSQQVAHDKVVNFSWFHLHKNFEARSEMLNTEGFNFNLEYTAWKMLLEFWNYVYLIAFLGVEKNVNFRVVCYSW